MNCWHCNTQLIWNSDDDIDEDCEPWINAHKSFSMLTILACPKCDSMVEVYYPRKENDNG